MNRRLLAKRTILARQHWLLVVSAVIFSYGWLTASNASCQLQEGQTYERIDDFSKQYSELEDEYAEFEDEYSELEDEYSVDFGDEAEEYSPRYGGNDFEDLPPAIQAVVIIIGVLFFLVMLGITIFILYLLYKLLDALPPQYRLMEPGLVWLLLIPCFNLIWNFFVYPRIARSYQNYFYAHGRTDVGDCGATLGVWFSVCHVLISIPCVNYITGIFCGPAMLVLLIIYLIKLHELKRQIPSGKTASAMDAQNPFAV